MNRLAARSVKETSAAGGEPRAIGRFIPISVGTLRPASQLEFDLYVPSEQPGLPLFYRPRDYPLGQADIDRLVRLNIPHLYITELGLPKYQQYLMSHLSEFIAEEQTPLKVRCRFLHDTARMMLEDSFQILNVERTLEATRELGRQVCHLVLGKQLSPANLYRMLRHDHHLVTHVINVSAYSVLLAERLGICTPSAIGEIAVGGLLHDLGLRGVPRTVLDNEAHLTPEQRRQIDRHPQAGFEELHGHEQVSWGQRMIVYQHHERCDGSGYPVRICREEIHWMARLCSVADNFDLLLRPRKNGRSPLLADVIAHMKEAAGRHLDKEMVHCWLGE